MLPLAVQALPPWLSLPPSVSGTTISTSCSLLTSRVYNLQYTLAEILKSIQFLKEMASSSGGAVDTIKNLGDLPSESFRMAMAVITMGPIVLAYPSSRNTLSRVLPSEPLRDDGLDQTNCY